MMTTGRRPLYTIGHSTRTVDELIDILRVAGVTRLVDIRRFPRSRTNPQFNEEALHERLGGAGIAYRRVTALGGRRIKSERIRVGVDAGLQERPFHDYADYAMGPQFRAGLRELLEMAEKETCAIMCAEAVWWRCHRRIVTDHVLAHGIPVVHLFTRTHKHTSHEVTRATYEVPVVVPYRLDLTVSALRRSATNSVDILTRNGEYLRVLGGFRDSVIVRVAQKKPDSLTVTLEGHADEHLRALSIVPRILGVDRELLHFNLAAARIPWLRPLAARMRGVKPPRYPTLWEACVNAIAFQQVSLIAASTICRRVVVALSPSINAMGTRSMRSRAPKDCRG